MNFQDILKTLRFTKKVPVPKKSYETFHKKNPFIS